MESFRNLIGDSRPVLPVAGEGEGTTTSGEPLTDFFGHFPTLAEVENYLIEQAMALAKGNQGMAAKLLGMGRQTLNKRLQRGK